MPGNCMVRASREKRLYLMRRSTRTLIRRRVGELVLWVLEWKE